MDTNEIYSLIDSKIGEKIRLDNEVEELEEQLSIISSKEILSKGYLREGVFEVCYDPYGAITLEGDSKDFRRLMEDYCKGQHASYTLQENVHCLIRYEDREIRISFNDYSDKFRYMGDELVQAFVIENGLKLRAHRMVDRNVRECEENLKRYTENRDRVNAIISVGV